MSYLCKTTAFVAALLFAIAAPAALGQGFPTVDFGGRIQADASGYSEDAEKVRDKDGEPVYIDGTEIRRFRLYLRGALTENWEYRLQYDFAGLDGGSNNSPDLKDGYFRYTGFDNQSITVGNFKVFSGLEELTSSNNSTFAERALVNALDEGRRLAIGYANWSDRHSLGLAYYGHEPNNDKRGSGITSRFVYRPLVGDDRLLHLGINLSQQQPDTARQSTPRCTTAEGDAVACDTFRVRARAGNHRDEQRIVNTGHILDVDGYSKLGLELAYRNGRLALQSEFMQQSITTGNLAGERAGQAISDPTFDGFYAEASYFLTHDTRPYSNSSATFGTVTPSNESGAWQIAARIENLNLTDSGITGGEVDAISLALNWYQTRNLRFTLNYVMAEADDTAVTANGFAPYEDPSSWILRLRYTF